MQYRLSTVNKTKNLGELLIMATPKCRNIQNAKIKDKMQKLDNKSADSVLKITIQCHWWALKNKKINHWYEWASRLYIVLSNISETSIFNLSHRC